MSSGFFTTGGAMQCEWCKSNLAQYKFSDSNIDKGATKVVCQGCFYVLSLSCMRQDLTVMNDQIGKIAAKIGADLGQGS